MLSESQWREWHHLRHEAVRSRGQWLALCNADGEPLYELPEVTDMTWPVSRGTIESVTVTVNVRTSTGRVHPIVSELVAEGLGNVNAVGELNPVTGPSRFVVLERSFDGELVDWLQRQTIRVTHVAVIGDAQSPVTLRIHGVNILATLDMLPAPSLPTTWTSDPFTLFTRDWVGEEGEGSLFKKPRYLAPVSMLTVADGGTVTGPDTLVLRTLIDDSLAAIYRRTGVTRKPYRTEVLTSPNNNWNEIVLRPTDQTIWKEIGEPALATGVTLGAQLWWPYADTALPTGAAVTYPQIVFTLKRS